MASAFLAQFAGLWKTNAYREFKWAEPPTQAEASNISKSRSWAIPSYRNSSDCEVLCYQYHLRLFKGDRGLDMEQPEVYIDLQRVRGTIKAPNGKILNLREKRLGVSLRTTFRMDLPIFSLINVHDEIDSNFSRAANEIFDDAGLQNCTEAKIWPCRRGAGIAAFVFRIKWTCEIWAGEWNVLFDEIDETLQVDVRLDLQLIAHTPSRLDY